MDNSYQNLSMGKMGFLRGFALFIDFLHKDGTSVLEIMRGWEK